jgi:hypothetical protein
MERAYLEDLGGEGRTILNDLREVGCERVECINMVQDNDRWRSLVNMV